MVRKVQRARNEEFVGNPPAIPKDEIQHHQLERKKKRKLTNFSLLNFTKIDQKFFSDLMIVVRREGSEEEGEKNDLKELEEGNSLLIEFMIYKLNHFKHDQKCSPLLPNVKVVFELEDVLDLVEGDLQYYKFVDQECNQEFKNLAISILSEFESDETHFESNIMNFTRDSESGLVNSVTTEYRMCGKQCIYKYIEDRLEIIFLLINKYEFVYFGHSDYHALCGMPKVRYVNSNGNATSLVNTTDQDWKEYYERREYYEENEILEEPVIVPLKKLLSRGRSFLENVLHILAQ